jgi:hypothetical protein
MTTSTTNTASKPVAPTFTDEQLDCVRDAYKKLHSVFATLPGTNLPTFEQMCDDPEKWNILSHGAVTRATNTYKARRAAKQAQFRGKLNSALEAHIASARAKKADYDAMLLTVPENAREFIRPFPKCAQVGVESLLSDMSDFLPKGTKVEQFIPLLKGMDYTIVKGGEKKDKLFVEIPLVPKTETK